MSTNLATQARLRVGALYVGQGPSAGGIGGAGNSPSAIKFIRALTAAITPTASLLTQTVFETPGITVTGARAGDTILVTPPSNIEAGLTWSAPYVSANDTVKFRIANVTASTITTTVKTWNLLWIKTV